MKAREIAALLVEIVGPPGTYETRFNGSPLNHLAERKRTPRTFIDGLIEGKALRRRMRGILTLLSSACAARQHKARLGQLAPSAPPVPDAKDGVC